jgi:hypothetical protein
MSDRRTPDAPTAPAPRATWPDRLAAATLWLPVVVISITATLWYDSLPADLPRQWNGAEVTSTAGTEIMIGITGSLALLAAIAGLIALSDAAAGIRRGLVLAAGFVAGLAAGVWLLPASLVIATGSATPDAGAWPLLVLVAGAYGFIPYALSTRRPPVVELPASGAPTALPLGATESGAWFTTVTVPMFLWLAVAMGIAAAGLTLFSLAESGAGSGSIITLVLVGLVCLAFARLRVTVDRRGLRVTSSLFRIPIKQVPLTEIASARMEIVRPADWGGWGYRIRPGRSAVVLTAGPAIVVQRHNGTLFAVTIPEAELPAALLTTLAAR